MTIDKIGFQIKAVNELYDITKIALKYNGKNILFTAPVGSGKTVISALYMDRFLKENINNNICEYAFIWISTSEGNLLNQSMKSIKNIVSYGNVIGLSDVLSNREIRPHDVVFINWESIRSDSNIARRGGENPSLESVITNSNVKIILLIDEAHESVGAEKSDEAVSIIDPFLTMHITATPKGEKENYDYIVKIDIEDVISEGIVKKGVLINHNLEDNSRSSILDKAIEKRNKIENELEKYERKIIRKPLVLIQIANDSQRLKNDNNDDINNATQIKELLISKGIPNDKIGIWLSEKENCQNIEGDIQNSDIEYLIFKQAISTGWDCPRAHILVRFRETKSTIFDIQTIGRILRTVERKHYENDLIDTAYIYTEYDDLEYKIDVDSQMDDKILNKENLAILKDDFKNSYSINIPMHKIDRVYNFEIEGNVLGRYVLEEIKENLNSFNINEKSLLKYIPVAEAKTINIANEDKFLNKSYIETKKNKADIINEFDNSIEKVYSKYNFKRVIIEALKNHPACNDIHDIRKLYISNKEQINGIIKDSIKEYEQSISHNVIQQSFYQIPNEVYYKNFKSATEKYSYDKMPILDVNITKSKSESKLEKWVLEKSTNIEWWLKNGVHGNNFSIAYKYTKYNESFYSLYYPDFLFITKDKKLFILDVKSADDKKDYQYVEEKYNAGKEYENEVNKLKFDTINEIIVSIVKFKGDEPFICISNLYNDNTNDPNNWVKLNNVF